MKKLFALLIAAGSFTTIFAQSKKIEEARRVMNGNGSDDRTVNDNRGSRRPGDNVSTNRSERIEEVNNEYDRKVNSVRINPTLSQAEKERRIRELENQRQRRIDAIKNGDRNSTKHKNHGKNKNKTGKGNNGKHLGWEKGVGNPHSGQNRDDQYKRDKRDDRDNEESKKNGKAKGRKK